jgi:hypothetical protein
VRIAEIRVTTVDVPFVTPIRWSGGRSELAPDWQAAAAEAHARRREASISAKDVARQGAIPVKSMW